MNEGIKRFYIIGSIVSLLLNAVFITGFVVCSRDYSGIKQQFAAAKTAIANINATAGTSIDENKALGEQIAEIGDLLKAERDASASISRASSELATASGKLAETSGGLSGTAETIRSEASGIGEDARELELIIAELKRRDSSVDNGN
jgi:type IV secretory pathway TrbL component